MYTLEIKENRRGDPRWRELSTLYATADAALDAASRLWEDEEFAPLAIRVKRTEILCTLVPNEAA